MVRYRIENPAAHRAVFADASALQVKRIVIAEIMRGKGETDNGAPVNLDDVTVEVPLLVYGQFKIGF